MNKISALAPLAALALVLAPPMAAQPAPGDAALAQRALDNLRAVVAHDHDLPRLHAAEDLAILGEPDPFAPIHDQIPGMISHPIFRIVYWRVRAREAQAAGKSIAPWAAHVEEVFFAVPDAPDKVNAAETLGKIGYYPAKDRRAGYRRAGEGDSSLAVEARWVLADSGKAEDENWLADLLNSKKEKVRGDTAYAMRFLPRLRTETEAYLVAAAEKEPSGSAARSYLYAAALVHATAGQRPALLRVVDHYVEKGSAEDKFEVMNALAQAGDRSELNRLGACLQPTDPYDNTDADIRVGAAYAILSILRK